MTCNEVNTAPTPHPDVNAVLLELFQQVWRILDRNLVGMYLEGSLANGDFDQDSDIDFVVVTKEAVPEDRFLALQAMHKRINEMDTQWTTNLEGFYISQHALRGFDAQHEDVPNLERGPGERLKIVHIDETWIVHRYILRERGIVMAGPGPKTLIDPILPEELRQAMRPVLHGWASRLPEHPEELAHQGYQSYIVLSLCRVLYTLERGEVVSKRKAAGWFQEAHTGKWDALIDQAWIGRHAPQLPASPEAIDQTLDLIQYVLRQASAT